MDTNTLGLCAFGILCATAIYVGCRSFEGVWHEWDLRVRNPVPLRRVS